MDIVTLGAALNGSKRYVNSHFKGGSNIQIVNNPDGTQTINASGEVSAEDTVAREAIAEHVLDKANPHEVTAAQVGLGNVDNTSDIDKPVSTAVQAALNAVDLALDSKQNVITDLSNIRSGAALGATAVQPVAGKGLSTNDYTTEEKNKLAAIEAQANKTVVDSTLNSSSTNPVQNKVVKSALDNKQASLTASQLAAVNSGITAEKLQTDESNISKAGAALVELVDGGAKNVLDLSKATNVIVGTGISYTLVDGILTVAWSGLAEAKTLKFKNIPHIEGTYILSGAQTETDPIALRADIRQGATASDVITMDYGQSDREPFTFQEGVFDYVIRVQSESGTAIFKPMICTVPAWDISQSYQPYRPSYQELYEIIKVLRENQ